MSLTFFLTFHNLKKKKKKEKLEWNENIEDPNMKIEAN